MSLDCSIKSSNISIACNFCQPRPSHKRMLQHEICAYIDCLEPKTLDSLKDDDLIRFVKVMQAPYWLGPSDIVLGIVGVVLT
jgi:hypothetical protein